MNDDLSIEVIEARYPSGARSGGKSPNRTDRARSDRQGEPSAAAAVSGSRADRLERMRTNGRPDTRCRLAACSFPGARLVMGRLCIALGR